MRTKSALLLVAASILSLLSWRAEIRAQVDTSRAGLIISKFRIQPKTGGALFVTIDGKEKQIAKKAVAAWIIERGRRLAYTTLEGVSGMGTGGTLAVYDVQTNQHKKLATSDDDFENLKEARSSDGKTALLLEQADAEMCSPTVLVIDPTRGPVFSENPAQLLSIRGDIILLGYFKEAEWEKNCEGKKMKPYKTKPFSLSALLKRRVITTRPSN